MTLAMRTAPTMEGPKPSFLRKLRNQLAPIEFVLCHNTPGASSFVFGGEYPPTNRFLQPTPTIAGINASLFLADRGVIQTNVPSLS